MNELNHQLLLHGTWDCGQLACSEIRRARNPPPPQRALARVDTPPCVDRWHTYTAFWWRQGQSFSAHVYIHDTDSTVRASCSSAWTDKTL